MITFKRMDELSFSEAHALFNKGFEGYMMPMHLSLDAFIGRFGGDGLSAAFSVVAYDGELPVGFILQGIRESGDGKIAWNGGTGIIPSHRGKKIGHLLMEEALRVLSDEDVDIATLEALKGNDPAISLYEKWGYEVRDRLLFLSSEGVLQTVSNRSSDVEIVRFPALQGIEPAIFPEVVPWQCHVTMAPKVGGEIVALKREDAIIAACLIREKKNARLELEGVTLFQCVNNGDEEDLQLLLQHALSYHLPIKRSTYNFEEKRTDGARLMMNAGFAETPLSQVFMIKEMSSR